jgi:hypothetical protein
LCIVDSIVPFGSDVGGIVFAEVNDGDPIVAAALDRDITIPL